MENLKFFKKIIFLIKYCLDSSQTMSPFTFKKTVISDYIQMEKICI